MMESKQDVISKLKQDILHWEGYKAPAAGQHNSVGLGPIESAFPNGIFPVSTIHELLCSNTEQVAACSGFISGLLSVLMKNGGACIWVGLSGNLFPLALKAFGVEPERIIFIHLMQDKDVLWVMEEALKCTGLAAVVGELREIDFKQSRRLQLAVEQSKVTGFVLRNDCARVANTACAARWKVSPLPSVPEAGLPGLGFPRWKIELLKVRNGQTGSWTVEWINGKFVHVLQPVFEQQKLMAG